MGLATGRVRVFTFPQQRLCRGQVVAGSGEIPAVRMHGEVKYTHATCQTLFEP